jgi:hypothetical protein
MGDLDNIGGTDLVKVESNCFNSFYLGREKKIDVRKLVLLKYYRSV